jgi:NADH-ubiquinone oxidoreductase chain 4
LAAVILKLGVYGAYRFFFYFLWRAFFFRSFWIIALSWGGLLARLIASRQADLKSLVAYSSIRHIGVLLVGVFYMGVSSLKGAFIIVLAHGFCSSSLFFLVNFFYERCFSRQIIIIGGEGLLFYGIAFWWFLFLAINFSAPPFVSLLGEILIMYQRTLIDYFVMFILILIRLLVAYFCIFVFSRVVYGKVALRWEQVFIRESFLLVCGYHFLPSLFLVLKTEIIWFC